MATAVFDPSQPFEAIDSPDVGAVNFDPSQPFESASTPEFFNPEPADELGVGEEVRGLGRSVLRGGRQFAQNFAVREMREQEQRQREYPDKLKQYEDDLANFDAENPSPGLIGAVQRKKLENVISGLKLELERATPKRKAAEVAFAENQTAIEKLPLTRAQEEFQKPETPWYSFFRNPVELSTQATAESLPIMAGAAVGAAAGGPFGTAAAMGQLSYLAESSARIKQAMQDDGVDLKKPEEVMAWFNDRAKADPAIAKADLAALGPAAFDALTAGIAGRWLRGAVGKGVKPVAIATGKEIGVQMAGGGAGSIAGSALAGEPVDWKDFVLEVAGELAPGEAVSNLRSARRSSGTAPAFFQPAPPAPPIEIAPQPAPPESAPPPTPSTEPRTVTATEQPTNIPVSGGPNAPPPPVTSQLIPNATAEPNGVVRVTYQNAQGNEIGYGQLDGPVINMVSVNEPFQKKGYGVQIIKDLRERGGLYGVAGTKEGLALMRSKAVGAREYEPNKFTFDPETPVLGGAEADLPAQQREQSRRNNAAQSESIRKELEAAKSAPPAETPKSSTQLTLPPGDAAPFTQFAQSIPASEVYHKADETGKDDFGIETQPHITVLYGLTQHDPSAVAPVITPKKPITVTLGKLSVFESKDYDVLKVDVSGADIRALNKEIAKLPNEQTFQKYTPHLTIAYLKKGEGKKYVGDKRFEGMKLTFPSVTFSPPSEIRAKTGVTEIPFSRKPAGAAVVVPPEQSATSTPKEPWQYTKAEWSNLIKAEYGKQGFPDLAAKQATDATHAKEVSDAMKAGKPVPPEVLADYPDLQPPATSPDEARGNIKTVPDLQEELYDTELQIGRMAKSVPVGQLTVSEASLPRWNELHAKANDLRRQISSHPETVAANEKSKATADADLQRSLLEREKRIALLPVSQRRNGWEIVKDGVDYVLRNPFDKSDVYRGKLKRVREVADESQPEQPTPPAKPAEVPTASIPESVELNELRITKEQRGLGRLNSERLAELEAKEKAGTLDQPSTASPESAPSVVDQAITKIEDLQKRLQAGFNRGDNALGIPTAILNTALDMAKLALKAGKTVAEAIDAAIAKIRESIATFDEKEVRDTLERELSSSGENLQHEEEPRAQVAGIPELGQMRPVEHLPEILAAVREKVIDARKPLVETLETAWRIARELTDPSPEVRAGHALKYHQTIGGADAGLVTLKQEIMLVGLKQALAGDDSLLRYTFDNSADFQTTVGGGATSVGRALRGEQGEFYGALYKSLRDIFGDQKLSNAQIASALDRDTFFDLIAGLKDMQLSSEEISTVLETGKTTEGDTLRDILEREGKPVPQVQAVESAEQVAARILDRYATSQSDTLSWTQQTWNTVREVFKGLLNGDVTHDEFRGTLDSLKVDRAITESLIGVAMRELDIRKQLVVVRARERRDAAWQREMENLATQGQRSAETALRNLELKNAGAEWLKPGNRNRVRDILNKAFSPNEPILQDPRPWIDALRDELEAAGVEFSTATQLAQQVYQARETQWVNANLRAMERAAEGGSIRSLVEAVIADPYRAQNSPEWLRKTAVNWFLSNGLTPERAEAAYKLFEPQFRKALADAQEKVARQVLGAKRKDPRTIKELVTLIRSGVLDPSKNWLDELAERRGWKKPTASQYGKLEELDEQLAQPDLSPLERRDIVEQQHRIIRHLGKLDGQAARTVAESFLASLLTGIRTFTVQFTAAVAGLRDVAISSASNPTNTLQFMRAMKNAVVGNFRSQLNYTWQKGISAFHINEVEQNFSQLERLHEDVMAAFKTGTPAQKAAAAAKYLFAQQRWALRALNAMDSASAAVIREYKLAYYSSLAFKEAGLDTRMISELLDAQQAIRQAEYEKWINAGLDHDRAHLRANATVDRTTRDFLSGKGVEDRLINAVFQSAENDSYSVVGRLAPGVQETGEGVSEGLISRFTMNPIVEFVGKQKAKGGWSTIAAQTMFGFVAIPWRATRFASTFMWYGLVRGGIDNYRTKRGLPTFWKQSHGNVLQSRARLREAIAGTVVGIAAGLLLSNTSDDDPEDKGFKVLVTGSGPANKNLKDAWIKRGFQPYAFHFKINGRIVSMPLTRLGEFIMYPFIISAAIDDAKWKQKERALTGKPPADPISLYAATMVGEHLAMMGQRGLLQTAGQLYQSMQQTGSFGKGVARLAAGTAAGIALPFKQLLSSISDMFVGPLDNSSAQAIVANAFPIVGLPFQNPAVNRFGDQMYDRSWYGRIARTGVPIAFQVDRAPENQKLYTLLVSDGAAPPELRRGNLENKYGPLTDSQFSDFAKKSGALLKSETVRNLSDLQRATPVEVKSFLSKAATQADKTAAAALGLQPLTKPEAATTVAGASLRAATSVATIGSAATPVARRASSGRLRASLSRRIRTPALGRLRSRMGRTSLATMRVPRLRRSRLRASLSRPRRGRFSVRPRMARARRPRMSYA